MKGSISINDGTGAKLVFDECLKENYLHSGYIPPLPDEQWLDGKHYFYDKIKNSNRDEISNKTAIKILMAIAEHEQNLKRKINEIQKRNHDGSGKAETN